jgi:hypothetical protein
VPDAPEELRITLQGGEDLALVGSLDVCATRMVEGEALIGKDRRRCFKETVCGSLLPACCSCRCSTVLKTPLEADLLTIPFKQCFSY